MSWWKHATREQRLAQIDGGIALNMTGKQVAINCGLLSHGEPAPETICAYASKYNRSFHGESVAMHERAIVASHRAMRQKIEGMGIDLASTVHARLFPQDIDAPLFDANYEDA